MPDVKLEVYLTKRLRKKLETISEPVGIISGWSKEGVLTGVDCASSMEYFLPGLKPVGFFCRLLSALENEQDFLSACKSNLVDEFKAPENDCLVIFVYPNSSGDSSKFCLVAKLYSSYYCSIEDLELTENFADTSDTIFIRASGQVPLLFEGSTDPELQEQNLKLAIDRLKTVFRSNMLVFLAKDSDNIFLKSSSSDEDDSTKILFKDFLKNFPLSDVDRGQKKSKRIQVEKVPLHFEMLLQATGQVAVENNVNHSLVIHCQRRDFLCVSTTLPVDVTLVTHQDLYVEDIYSQLTKAVLDQLDKFQKSLLSFSEGTKFPTLEVYYFHPSESEFPLTVIYPAELLDKDLEKTRKNIHSSLFFPCDRPLFRKVSCHVFPDSSNARRCLINPHVGLSPSGVQDGVTAMVYGKYAYHHYMQDLMNDDGWGCAYRSLQTIVSWFRLQGYTDKKVPTHKEIQQALVEIGDKPASFVGSRKWIGSQEVSFCLDHLLGVTSRILCANSGSELGSKSRELLHHFQTHGTPIMIGGGVLAHTILGIDFNPNSGDVKFLVLDPHYTGSEDLGIIQSKGWCGWKKLDFWNKTAFYNLCLPQRPIMF